MKDPFGLVGTLLERKYRVDEAIAEGGFGVVYQGRHLALDVPVAIKVLRRAPDADPDAWLDSVAQFQEEAKAIARLKHPAVVRVMDTGGTDLPWMALEWIEGETLQAHLAARRGKGRDRASTLALLRPVIEAIAEAHTLGISHRDLKPSNVMLGPTGARVLDFGIAKLFAEDARTTSGETSTNASVRAFSAVSAAPEQLAGTRTGPWTDVYALGLMVTEVLTDQPPYPENDPAGRYEVAFDAKLRPTPKKFGVDAGPWEKVIEQALAVRPNDRQADAGLFLSALEGEGVQTKRPSGLGIVLGIFALAIFGGVGAKAMSSRVWNAAVAEAKVSCTGHLACGKGAACNQGTCVLLASEDCTVLADEGALTADDTIWVGSLFPMTGDSAKEYGLGNVHAVDLARRDFVSIMGGTASQKSGDAARPIGVIACDDAKEPKRAAEHLVGLGAPVVIGFRNGVETIDLATSLLIPKGIAAFDATSTNPLVTRIPQPNGRLVWRTTYNARDTATAIAAFLVSSERIALVRSKNAQGAALADAVAHDVGATEDRYRDFAYDEDAPDALKQYASVEHALEAFGPEAIIFSGSGKAVVNVLVPFERQTKTAKKKPKYVSIALINDTLLQMVGMDHDLGTRLFGVTTASSSPANLRFVAHYNETFEREHVTRTNAPNTAYDAFYLVAFASYALGGREVTGRTIASAIPKLLPPGNRIEAGLTNIFDGYGELASGRSIDFVGATGAYDFDLTTGDAPFDQSILCVGYDETGRANDGIESGIIYLANEKRLIGQSHCQ